MSRNDQERIYSDAYFSSDGDWSTGVWKEDYLACDSELQSEVREVLGLLPCASGRLLDIGCAGGIVLDQARRSGYEVMGVELNRSMAEHARHNLSLDVIHATVEGIPETQLNHEFDAILLLDSLEHIPQPGMVADRTSRWIAPRGFPDTRST